MEQDERGRPVRRPPPPGHRGDDELVEGYPAFEHNQWTFEGEIERLGAFARGVNRVRGIPRGVGILLAFAVALPFAVGVLAALWGLAFD